MLLPYFAVVAGRTEKFFDYIIALEGEHMAFYMSHAVAVESFVLVGRVCMVVWSIIVHNIYTTCFFFYFVFLAQAGSHIENNRVCSCKCRRGTTKHLHNCACNCMHSR